MSPAPGARVMRRIGARLAGARAARWILRLVATLFVGWLAWMAVDLTPARWWVDEVRFARPRDAFAVVDRRGEVLRHARVDGIDRRWVELRDVDPIVVEAFIAAEDARFREHDGVDTLALVRAAATALRPWGRRSGGSTITQQVVKLVHGRPHGLSSKPLEVLRARALERILTKDQILEQYLNRVPFGDRIQGVARASEVYFGHSVGDVSTAEAAMLAGIPQAPTANEPRRHPERAKRRAAYVLGRLAARGVIDEAERAASVDAAAISLATPRPDGAPRLVDRALAAWRSGMIERRGGDLELALDGTLARDVDRLLADGVDAFARRGVTNAAGVVVAHATGEVLAYTGAAKRSAPGGSLDLLTRKRQPGSTLKPFAYELFFERGGTAATVVDDIALPRTGARGTIFEAKDYDGRERGPVRARVALAASLNLAALDVAARLGQDALVGRLHELGFQGVEAANRYGGAAVLGGLDVTPMDLASAYATLARGGTTVQISLTRAPARRGHRIMTDEAAAIARDVLFDGTARAEAFGDDLVDEAGGRFALKTGTSSGFRDAWAAAFDDDFTVVVWMGDPSGRPMAGVSGFEASAPIAARILRAARERAAELDLPPSPRPKVELVSMVVCEQSGLRAGVACTHARPERFAQGALPGRTCDAHDAHGDLVLPARYAAWVEQHHPSGIARTFREPVDDAARGPLVVREPRDGARLVVDPTRGVTTIPLRARVAGVDVHEGIAWRVDGEALAGPAWSMSPGVHEVVAEWRGRRSEPARVRVDEARPPR